MKLHQAIEDARRRFPIHGEFNLQPGESVNLVVGRESVPNSRGVYAVFSGLSCREKLLYVGKAGTLNRDGSWKRQGLAKRLTMKQDGLYRREFFCNLIEKEELAGLTIIWFVTHNDSMKVLPALAELQLLQAYYDDHGRLPKLNHCI